MSLGSVSPGGRQPRTRWRDFEAAVPVSKAAIAAVLADDEDAYVSAADRIDRDDHGPFAALHLWMAIALTKVVMTKRELNFAETRDRVGAWRTFLQPRVNTSVLDAILAKADRPGTGDPWARADRVEFISRWMDTTTQILAFALHDNPLEFDSWSDEFDDALRLLRKEWRRRAVRRQVGLKS